ncbi:MAG TPA: tetratricopeptide repeat protein [Gemmatimonadales bacterium]
MTAPFLLAAALAFQARGACSPRATAVADSAWQAYRADRIAVAAARFAVADSLCRGLPEVQIGLGFVALRQGAADRAERRFQAALRADSLNADGWYGLGLARARQERREAAIAAFRRALEIAPGYADAREQLTLMGDLGGPLPRVRRPAAAQVAARTVGERFEIRQDDRWQPFYVKGINLGAARPGKFPSEFPTDDSTYSAWLSLMAAAHANVVRAYTILPPAFYRGLQRWNEAHPDEALWLVQGVWAEAPPGDDYDDRGWKTDFRKEMQRVVDLLHGHAIITPRPGHASGRYTVDVSGHVLAFIVGREWEPYTIRHYNTLHPSRTSYRGTFLVLDKGTPADAWMAEQCDFLMRYEWDTWHAQRPIAYTNWPTLDPLHHPTEPTLDEEGAVRERLGLPPLRGVREYDNDDQSLDAMRVRTTEQNQAGYFAAYHAYPYYPDFMDYDPSYGTARSSYGLSHYYGYLLDLKRHHAGRPLLIAEYGVPSSRGLAHLQPEGLHHGGHDEAEMAALDVRLTREIHEAGLAGGILFAWIDEWFKHNWVVIDLEVPLERTRLWHNFMDAEQNYGLLGQYAGRDSMAPAPGGDPARWRALRALEGTDTLRLRVGSDESYLYLALETGPGAAPFDAVRTLIGIDTYRSSRGQFRLPEVPGIGTGVEFYLDVSDTAAGQLFVARDYSPYLVPRPGMGPTALDPFYNYRCSADVQRDDARFDSMFVTTNRFRVTRAGATIPASGVNRGRLRYGRAAESSLADWFVDRRAGLVEIRLPWGLLNVTDPSSRTVLTAVREGGVFETDTTDGFRFVVARLGRAGNNVLTFLPAAATYAWRRWEEPTWHERLKPAYDAMRDVWGSW